MNSNSENSKNGSINQNSHNRSVVKIGDEFEGYPVESFFTCDKLKEDLDHVLVTGGMIRDRIRVMAYNIAQHYGSEKFTLLCVLKGGYYFFSEIVDALKSIAHNSSDNKPEFSVEFIRLKSYVNDSSSGDVRIFNPEVLQTLVGKNVLVIEDIIDSGLSMHSLMKKLDSVGVESVKVAVMMVKRNPVNTFLPHFIGFEIPDAFVVGCNLDYNEQFRNLQHVCVISDLGKKKYAHVKA